MKLKLSTVLFLYLIVIFILHIISFSSDVSINRIQIGDIRLDHLLHVLVFIPLPILLRRITNLKYTVLITFLVAISFEFIHLVIPYRTFTLIDLGSNIIGASLGNMFLFLQMRNNK